MNLMERPGMKKKAVTNEQIARELVKIAKELLAAKGRFYIEFYKDGKRKRKFYDTLEEAKEVADKIFKQTGIMVGIQEK
jgi:hypothetical protein